MIYASGRECLQARTLHDTAVAAKDNANMALEAAKEKAKRLVEAAKNDLKAAAVVEDLAAIRVTVADKRRATACHEYSHMMGHVYIDDIAVKNPAAVSALDKTQTGKKAAPSRSGPKGTGKARPTNIDDDDDEIEDFEEGSWSRSVSGSGSGGNDMDLDN